MELQKLQICLGLMGMAVCVPVPSTARQNKAPSCLMKQQAKADASVHSSSRSTSQAIETLFARVSARARIDQQSYWKQSLQDHTSPAYLYHNIEIGTYARRYRISDWRRVSMPQRKEREGGFNGNWAEVVEKGVDSHGAWGDQGGWTLYHHVGAVWQRVTAHEGLGYDPESLRKRHVPRQIIQRLHLLVNE